MYSIVIIDDEKISANVIANIIEKSNLSFNVTQIFDNSVKALDYLLNNYTDVIITDIKMPELSGLELIEKVKKFMPKSHFIIVSGYAEFDYAKQAMEYDVKHYLLKPIDMEELIFALKNIQNLLDVQSEHSLLAKKTNEMRERFLYETVFDDIDEKEIKTRFADLNFPFDYNDSCGYLFVIDIKNFNDYILKNWKYSAEGIGMAFNNIFKTCINSEDVYTVTDDNNKFVFFCFGENIGEQKNNILQSFKDVLDINVSVMYEKFFENISDILKFKNEVVNIKEFEMAYITRFNFNQEAFENDEIIKKAAEYIEQNYSSEISRDAVANAVFLSSSYFSLYFQKKTGVSFYDYLLYVRTLKAIELLKKGYTAEKVSNGVGYGDWKFFNRKFKQFTSYTLTEYKKKYIDNKGK